MSFRRVFVLALITALVIITVTAIYRGNENTAQLSAYSDNWNDISDFREQLESLNYDTSAILSSPVILNDIDDPEDTLFIVTGVEREYSVSEINAIKNFNSRGGSIIMADDFGHGNGLSEEFKVTIWNQRLWDEQYVRNPSFVVIDVNDFRAGGTTFSGQIILNDPSAIRTSEGRVLARSTESSWLDTNDNEQKEMSEPYRSYQVVVEITPVYSDTSAKAGNITFISDPSIFINDMWGMANNSLFLNMLVFRHLPSGGEVIFDESRHVQDEKTSSAVQLFLEGMVKLSRDDFIKTLAGVIVVLVAAVIVVAVENPSNLRHNFNLSYSRTLKLEDPFIQTKDTSRIRYLFLEKVRLAQGYSLEDFQKLSEEEVANLIGSEELAEFALNFERLYSTEELEIVLLHIQRWR